MSVTNDKIYSNKKKRGGRREFRKILSVTNEYVEYEDIEKGIEKISLEEFKTWAYEPVYYQIEIKKYLVNHKRKHKLWKDIIVDIDAEEVGKDDSLKKSQSDECVLHLNAFKGVNEYRTDIKATDILTKKNYYIEVEGFSSKQQEQAFYSALSQIILRMKNKSDNIYGIAVPNTESWIKQVSKISKYIRSILNIHLFLVDKKDVIEVQPCEDIFYKIKK